MDARLLALAAYPPQHKPGSLKTFDENVQDLRYVFNEDDFCLGCLSRLSREVSTSFLVQYDRLPERNVTHAVLAVACNIK